MEARQITRGNSTEGAQIVRPTETKLETKSLARIEKQYLVTNGILIKKPFANKSIVLAQGWPSLSLVMRSLGFEVETYVEGLGSESIPILQSLLGGKINMMTDLENLFEVNSDTSFWIQGSSHFVEEQKLELETKQVRNITCIAPSKGRRRDKELERDKRWNHVIISHAAVGGITLGRWACITPSQVPESDLRKPDKVQRSLQHILSHTESGFPHVEVQGGSLKRKRNADQEIVYQGDSRIVPGSSKVVVSTHCVKQPHYPRIKRFLITRELLDVYDIQTRDQDIIGKVPKALISKVIENIASAAPEKVVYRIVMQVKEACLQVKAHNVQANSIENEKDTLARTSQSLQWLKYEEDDEILNDEKAARDDDAGIETQQWDRYLIRGYNAKYQTRILTSKFPHISFKIIEPLICKGGLPNEKHDKLLEILRQFSVCTFRRNVTSSYLKYMRDKYGKFDFMEAQSLYKLNKGNTQRLYLIKLFKGKVKYEEFMKDYLAGLEAVHRAANSSFWDWDAGSSLFFWRWPTDFVKEARDGTKVNITGKLPRYKSKQQWPKDENIKEKMMAKWIKIIRRKYVQPGQVVSLTGSFPVAKGENDIRMVYDATKCGLNEQIWAPNFMLPTIDMTLRHVTETGWFGDIDLGEMFLNFPLDSDLRAYVGIDATELRELLKSLDIVPEELLGTKGRIFLRWVRCLMGLRCSPFNAVRAMSWAADIIKGDRFEEFNTFRWDTFCLNLPGSKDYDPKFPLGYKWNQETKSIAADFETYVDDIRSSDGTEEGCVLATRRIASLCNHLGIQDAARKRRFPSKSPGVWCGAKTSADNVGVYTSTTQVKWDKGKTIINGWLQELEESRDFSIEHKPMLSGRGFLVHLARTYPSMVPFLKGVHHTLENWRRGRTADGWKFSTDEWRSFLSEVSEVKSEFKIAMKEYIAGGEADAPARVKGVKRLKGDLISLLTIMKSEKPPQRLVRGLLLAYALYGFGDASGAGFGSSWENNRGTRFRIGVWGKDNVDKSSNYRELCNLVESLEQMAEEERLSGTEVYFFTDNSTAEAAFFKGSSTSKLLHELVTRLRKLEMTRGCKIVLVHVSGERMKWQGSDGLSRGNLLEGVMKGVDMLSYIPLHKTPLERSKELLKWILSWCKDDQEKQEVEVLAPKDWFVKGHDLDGFEIKNGFKHPKFKTGTYIWQPPPAAAEIACEEIRKARCKRTTSTHIFICPRLMTPYWRSHLHKSCDLMFEIPAGTSYWPTDMFEPLVLAIYFPFIRYNPWQLRRTPSMLELGDRLQRMWRNGEDSQGIILRKLWKQTRKLENMPERLVFKVLHCFGEFGVPCERGQKRSRSNMEKREG